MKNSSPTIKYINLSDEKGLQAIGCPWKTSSLYTMRTDKKYPKLFTKIGHRVYLVVEELERMLEEGIGK